MRYPCRPAGKPAFYDTKFPGLYNARRDNLEKFWKGQFGHSHGLIAVSRFYENVDRDGKNVVLEFNPRDGEDMVVPACGPVGLHPARLTCCRLRRSPMNRRTRWPPRVTTAASSPSSSSMSTLGLNPDPKNLSAMQAILDDRERPYYEHRMAA